MIEHSHSNAPVYGAFRANPVRPFVTLEFMSARNALLEDVPPRGVAQLAVAVGARTRAKFPTCGFQGIKQPPAPGAFKRRSGAGQIPSKRNFMTHTWRAISSYDLSDRSFCVAAQVNPPIRSQFTDQSKRLEGADRALLASRRKSLDRDGKSRTINTAPVVQKPLSERFLGKDDGGWKYFGTPFIKHGPGPLLFSDIKTGRCVMLFVPRIEPCMTFNRTWVQRTQSPSSKYEVVEVFNRRGDGDSPAGVTRPVSKQGSNQDIFFLCLHNKPV